ncbi:MAG: hypothetical protein NTX25_20065 [Proteobacteria bacterium]|nr:hypothetical protein [Pseudomonadota bacterium]
MRFINFSRIWHRLPLVLLLALFSLASFKAYIKIQTTLIGYRIGQTKQAEAEMLESQSYLKMELAKLTTKENLAAIAAKNPENHKDIWAAH